MGRVAAGVMTTVLALVGLSAAAGHASEPPTGWDGSNPFRCELQQAGFGTEVPHPDADPYCVEFDKRHQNVTQLGVVDFLSNEPARVAAAGDKCFYFQSDHWRGSVVQDDGSTKTYEWDGHYFFDRAKGEGGVWVTNFNLNGKTADPSALPGVPADFARYFGPGTGGVITRNDIPADPSCAAKADAQAVYAPPRPQDRAPSCATATGDVAADHVGPLRLGDSGARVRTALGEPVRVHRGFLRYCVAGGGKLLVGQPGDRSGDAQAVDDDAPAQILLTTARALKLREVGRDSRARALRGAFPKRRLRFVQGTTRVYEVVPGVLAGLRSGRVRFLAVYDRKTIRTGAALRDWLRRSQ